MHKVWGHLKIVAPDLPGHGVNKQSFRQVDFRAYVNYVLLVLEALPKPVILVGHSMAGAIISEVAERIPSQIACLVYVGAFVPSNGNSLIDEERAFIEPGAASVATINRSAGCLEIDLAQAPGLFYHCLTKSEATAATKRLQPQPLKPFLSPILLSEKSFGKTPKFYIYCQQDRAISLGDQQRMQAKINCPVFNLNTDHSPFLSAPVALVGLLNIILAGQS